jgi:hypothetical protein
MRDPSYGCHEMTRPLVDLELEEGAGYVSVSGVDVNKPHPPDPFKAASHGPHAPEAVVLAAPAFKFGGYVTPSQPPCEPL